MENCHKVKLIIAIQFYLESPDASLFVYFLKKSKPLTLKWFTYLLIHLSIIAFEN